MLMKREHINYLQWSAAVSLVCAILGTISLSTDFWINGTAKSNITDVQDSDINYGLFSGTLVRRILLSPKSYDIYCKYLLLILLFIKIT